MSQHQVMGETHRGMLRTADSSSIHSSVSPFHRPDLPSTVLSLTYPGPRSCLPVGLSHPLSVLRGDAKGPKSIPMTRTAYLLPLNSRVSAILYGLLLAVPQLLLPNSVVVVIHLLVSNQRHWLVSNQGHVGWETSVSKQTFYPSPVPQ